MMTVRFPDGTSIQYNTATNVAADNHSNLTLVNDRNQWIAKIPAGASCVIESTQACRIYNALTNVEQVRLVMENMRNLSYNESRILGELKKELANFNAQTRCWKRS